MRRSLLVVTLAFVTVAACGDNYKGPPDAGPGSASGDQPPVEMTCATLPAASGGNTCDVTPAEAGSTSILLKGNVLTPTTLYKGGQVLVGGDGKIACVGCDCGVGGELTLSCPDASISPGLINTHDHITFDQDPPYHDTGERYEDRQQWRTGADSRTSISAPGGASNDQISWSELRFLMGGTTSISGSGGQPGLIRNVDKAEPLQGGLGKKPAFFDTFPLNDSSGTRSKTDCNYGAIGTTGFELNAVDAYEPHTSEGIDTTAHNEFLCQSSTTYDASSPGLSQNLMQSKTAMIHAVGLNAIDYGAMSAAGTGLIWSPRSNITLYGDTARVTTAHRLGVEIALGTDWLPSGSMNLLRELACADSYNKAYLGGYFRDDQLWKMVTSNAASVLSLGDVIGTLDKGKVADIAIFAGHGKLPFRAVLEAEPKDVALVMRGGKVLYGDASINTFADSCDTVDVCGTSKRVCVMDEVSKTYDALKTGAAPKTGTIYPAFACGVPDNEPTCTPKRPNAVDGSSIYTGEQSAMDSDGDGIPDASDNCPKVFNPIRPMDGGAQPDFDGDGLGDACDPCPLDANITECKPVDRDKDGVLDINDNCPALANPDQADADKDGVGDACDACPNDANPNYAACPATIYAIDDGTWGVGQHVVITNALVTGLGSNGFFVQVKETDAGYNGSDHSGVFVFTGGKPDASVLVGTRVSADGFVDNFHGEVELDGALTVTVTSTTPEAAPAPVVIASLTDIKTGSAKAAALDGVLVKVGPGTVTAVDTTVDFALTQGADHVFVDSFVSPLAARPVGQNITSVTGILAQRGLKVGTVTTTETKIEPRTATDIVLGAALVPANTFARVGVTTDLPSFPVPLAVVLPAAATADTTVMLTSSDETSLTVSPLVIPTGATTGVVKLTAIKAAADVTITATIGVQSTTAHVRVLAADENPATLTLSPKTMTIAAGGSQPFTATLDLPALVDQVITFSVAPTTAGSFSAGTVTIAAGQLAGTVTYNDAVADTSATATITASTPLGAATVMDTAVVTVGAASSLNHLVISQIYGGGGNSMATFTNDFIELHNPTANPISVNGMSVQYVSAALGNWAATPLPNVMVPAGGYLLVQEFGGTVGAPLPMADATGTINMSSTNGKVALVGSVTPLTDVCPAAALMIDLIGYGSATCSEGMHPASVLSNTTANVRDPAGGGCKDTNDNAADFALATGAAIVPRNHSTTPVLCP